MSYNNTRQHLPNESVFIEHRPSQEGQLPFEGEDVKSPSCGVCLEDITEQDMKECQSDGKFLSDSYLWAPCCNGWYHRNCVDSLAKSTGYFFKCALCNNKEVFENEMKKFGVYVPERVRQTSLVSLFSDSFIRFWRSQESS